MKPKTNHLFASNYVTSRLQFSLKSINTKRAKAILVFWLFFTGAGQYANSQNITRVAGIFKSACAAAPCGDGGKAMDANLYSPSALALDAEGNVYITEYSNHAIRKINVATGTITTIAGTQRSSCLAAPCGDGGSATSAQLNGPRGITVDTNGDIYIADFSNHVIRKISKATGIITTVAGTMRASCATTPCGDGGQATDARLSSPTGVAIDKEGNIYIADYGNHAIRKVTKTTGVITTVAGTLKSSCMTAPCGDNSAATSALFNGPSSIAFDSEGNFYVTEYGNHSVRKINKTTGIITTYAGTQRASCSAAPCGDGGLATHTNARLTSPFSLTIDKNDNLFIADASNAAIRRVDKATGIISTVVGQVKTACSSVPCGDGGSPTSALLSNPFGVAFNAGNELYIVEYGNQVVRKVNFNSTLPVRFINFSAISRGNVVELNWKTAEEINVERYEVEKSSSRPQFQKEGEVKATGSSINDYKWTDYSSATGHNFYRVKAIDKDGSARYSPVVRVKAETTTPVMRISPNPVTNNTLHLQVTNATTGEYEVTLFNSEGQKVYAQRFSTAAGIVNKAITLPASLSKGIYTLFLSNEKQELNQQQFVLQ